MEKYDHINFVFFLGGDFAILKKKMNKEALKMTKSDKTLKMIYYIEYIDHKIYKIIL